MSDITLCNNRECHKRRTCRRFMFSPGRSWLPYSNFKVDGECDGYWEVKEGE